MKSYEVNEITHFSMTFIIPWRKLYVLKCSNLNELKKQKIELRWVWFLSQSHFYNRIILCRNQKRENFSKFTGFAEALFQRMLGKYFWSL